MGYEFDSVGLLMKTNASTHQLSLSLPIPTNERPAVVMILLVSIQGDAALECYIHTM